MLPPPTPEPPIRIPHELAAELLLAEVALIGEIGGIQVHLVRDELRRARLEVHGAFRVHLGHSVVVVVVVNVVADVDVGRLFGGQVVHVRLVGLRLDFVVSEV